MHASPARNIQVVLGGAGLLFFGWSWANFSGPFRLFVDLQLRLLGNYSEPVAAVACAMTIAVAVALALAFLKLVYPGLSGRTADAVVAIVFVAVSLNLLWHAWHLWHRASTMPRLSDPVQVVDLGTIGDAAPPLGHVRVIGIPDRHRLVLGYSTGRYGSGYWEAWAPMMSRRQNEPVRIVATARAPDRVAAIQAIPADPEGMLLSDSVDTRTIYEARQRGLEMDGRTFALYLDEGVRFDRFVNAALLGAAVVLFWGLAAFDRLKQRGVANTPPARLADAPISTDAPSPPPGAALLYVMRPEPGFNSPSYQRVSVDGVRVADLKSNRYTVVTLRPGPHTLAVNTRVSLASDTIARFEAAAGDVVVYRLEVPAFSAMRLQRVADIPAAQLTLKGLKPVAANNPT